jgi:hypothetical protein
MYAKQMPTAALRAEIDLMQRELRTAEEAGDRGRAAAAEERLVECEAEADTRLTEVDRKILAALDERGGSLTGDVAAAARPWGRDRRVESAWTRERLVDLKKRGLVAELDDQKPVCWLRTAAGTEALAVHDAGRTGG